LIGVRHILIAATLDSICNLDRLVAGTSLPISAEKRMLDVH